MHFQAGKYVEVIQIYIYGHINHEKLDGVIGIMWLREQEPVCNGLGGHCILTINQTENLRAVIYQQGLIFEALCQMSGPVSGSFSIKLLAVGILCCSSV